MNSAKQAQQCQLSFLRLTINVDVESSQPDKIKYTASALPTITNVTIIISYFGPQTTHITFPIPEQNTQWP